jgi:hypothetical protein
MHDSGYRMTPLYFVILNLFRDLIFFQEIAAVANYVIWLV